MTSDLQYDKLPKPRFSNQTRWMENHVDDVWETLCLRIESDRHFTREEVVSLLMVEYGWAESTAKGVASACLAYFVALDEGGLFKVPGKKFRFHDLSGK